MVRFAKILLLCLLLMTTSPAFAQSQSLVGTWGDVTSGSFGVQSSSGISTGRGGTARGYSFKADKTYTFVTFADIVFNNSKIQTYEAGTYKISGSTITLSPQKSIYRRNGVDEAPASDWRQKRTYQWRIEGDDTTTNLVLITGDFEDRFMLNR
jgi:hypothetical protein